MCYKYTTAANKHGSNQTLPTAKEWHTMAAEETYYSRDSLAILKAKMSLLTLARLSIPNFVSASCPYR